MELLKSNHNDNIGARYSIVAILEGFDSQEEYEEQFASGNGMTLEYMAQEEWFEKSALKKLWAGGLIWLMMNKIFESVRLHKLTHNTVTCYFLQYQKR